MNEIPITSKDLRKLNQKPFPKNASDFSRYSFWTYTRLETADLILSSGTFRINNLKGMNDLEEATRHAADQERVFALCFCNSNTEKIPLWYLYSGLSGKGAALDFSAAKMIKWLNSITEVYAVQNGQAKMDGDKLIVGQDVELQYGWVYYQKPREPNNIFYRNKWYRVNDVSEFHKDNYFIKAYPWEYEREFRIVFITRTADYDALFVDIPEEICNAIKTMLAPELQPDQFKLIQPNLTCIGNTHPLIYSKLSIRMNLFNRNIDSLLECLNEELSQPKPKLNAHDICAVIQNAKLCAKAEKEC